MAVQLSSGRGRFFLNSYFFRSNVTRCVQMTNNYQKSEFLRTQFLHIALRPKRQKTDSTPSPRFLVSSSSPDRLLLFFQLQVH